MTCDAFESPSFSRAGRVTHLSPISNTYQFSIWWNQPILSYVDSNNDPFLMQLRAINSTPFFQQPLETRWSHGDRPLDNRCIWSIPGIANTIEQRKRIQLTANTWWTHVRNASKAYWLCSIPLLLGGQGGLVLFATKGQSIWKSPHAMTAAIGIDVFDIKAILPKFCESPPAARDTHAHLGSATMGALFSQMATGIKLEPSF